MNFQRSRGFQRAGFAKRFSRACDARAVHGIVKPWHIGLRLIVVALFILVICFVV